MPDHVELAELGQGRGRLRQVLGGDERVEGTGCAPGSGRIAVERPGRLVSNRSLGGSSLYMRSFLPRGESPERETSGPIRKARRFARSSDQDAAIARV